jgi:transposase-like protein
LIEMANIKSDMPKGGRPRFDFSDKIRLVRNLASIQCTDEEIAAGIGCSQDTLARGRKRDQELDAAIIEGRANGRMSLRRAQYQKAMDGNPAMLIWLGKQVLGQRERADLEDMDEMPVAIEVRVVNGRRDRE